MGQVSTVCCDASSLDEGATNACPRHLQREFLEEHTSQAASTETTVCLAAQSDTETVANKTELLDRTSSSFNNDISVVVGARGSTKGFHLEVANAFDRALVVVRVSEGPFMEWNRSHPSEQVLPYDRITGINGVRGTAVDLFRELRRVSLEFVDGCTAAMFFRRPQVKTVKLDLSANCNLGIQLTCVSDSLLVVGGLEPTGAIAAYNDTFKEAQVRTGDVLSAVNSTTGAAHRVVTAFVEAQAKAQPVTLRFQHHA